jgi:two-component system invasion response regulator UvrY
VIRVLIVDDHPIVREGLKWMLEGVTGIEVGGEAANGVEALKKLRCFAGKWDVVLLDISMPEKDGIDTLQQIMDGNSGVKVLILSMHPEDKYAVQLMKAGASGYMMKDSSPKQLVDAIREVVAGKKHISLGLAELLLQECSVDSGKVLHDRLSNREYQVLQLLGAGKNMSEIAEAMSVSVKTVSTYRANILEKMNMKNNAELIFYVIQNGLRDLPLAEN